MTDRIPIVFCFSGGRSSALVLHMMLLQMDENDVIIFNNMGKKREETLEFVQKVSEHYFCGN